ncbi:MAG: glycoside hydrolase family 10 protein [Paludibacteraceae bacterium]
MRLKKLIVLLAVFTASLSLFSQSSKREFRAVWIATVANIDWPGNNNLSPSQQRTEMRLLLDQLKQSNINAIVVQIRPTADSFYPSQLEPWSVYLNGKNGQRPHPYYDPLQFIIEEAHQRCMEVHAWLNPYRVTNEKSQINRLDKQHVFHTNNNLIVKYGEKYYFNPGLDETRAFLNKVVEDIVERYDIDAIHFDDYFYPYPEGKTDFPDEDTFINNSRGFASKADWRRNNVDMVIAELQQTIKSLKPWVQFGISPFGVWRNDNMDQNGSATRAGVTNYDDLYADILKWLRLGHIDYVVPQLYWEIGKKVADYEILAKWWSDHCYGKNLYVGLYSSGLTVNKTPAWKNGNELARQLKMNRQKYPKIEGEVYFSATSFVKNPKGLTDTLKNNYYKHLVLHPICNNIKGEPSAQPQNLRIIKDGHEAFLIWDSVKEDGGCKVRYYVVYGFKGNKIEDLNNPENIIAITTENCVDLRELDRKFKGRNAFVVTAVNRYNVESIPTLGVTRRL